MSSTARDVYERIKSSQKETGQQGRLEVANDLQVDYDRAQRVFAVAANTTLPYDIVDSDLENLEGQLKRNQFDKTKYTDAVNGAPVFNEFAAEHPYHLAVLERDRKSLTRLERSLEPIFQGWDSGWAMTEIAEIRDRQLTNFENPDNEADKARLDELGKFSEGGMFGADSWYAKLLVGTAQQVPIQAWLVGESLDEIAIGTAAGAAYGAYAGSAAGGVGALPGAGVGALTGAGRGFLVGRTEAAFRLERGLAYDELIGMGLDEEEARWGATAVGGANAALESIGMGALVKRIPGFDKIMNDRVGGVINSVLMKPTFKQAAARATLKYGEGVATEVVTEILQEGTLIVAGEILKSNARDRGDDRMETQEITSDEFWGRVGDIAVHTLYGVGLIGAVGPGHQFYRDNQRAYQANRLGLALDAMGEAAEESETRKNVPSKWTEFTEKLTSDGKTVLVDKQGFVEYFQTQGMDPEQVAASVGVTDLGAQINDPAVTDIEIPAGQYLAKIAPSSHHKGLKQDIRGKAGAMTMREAALIDAAKPAAVKAIEENAAKINGENEAIDEQIVNEIKQQLVEAATSPEAAENQKWIMVGLPNLARRMGMDPRDLYEQFYAGVIADDQQSPGKDVDIYVDPYLDMIRGGTTPNQRDIFGPSLIDEIKHRGGLAPDSELDARDVGKQIRGIIKEAGDTLDGVAEYAAEKGYIAERDPNLLLEAIERELDGEPVFGTEVAIDEAARELSETVERLEELLGQAGIDISSMSNTEVRAAMEDIEVLDQLDDESLDIDKIDELTRTAVTSAQHDPHLLAQITGMLPELALTQEFGEIELRTPIIHEGKAGTRVSRAQKDFERTMKRKGILDKLLDCIHG